MTVLFPRTMPADLLIAGMSFMPQPMVEISPVRGGRQIAVDLGPTLWRGQWRSLPLDQRQSGEVRAWYDTLLSAEQFLAYDKVRQYPLAYENGWGSLTVGGFPFNGTCQLANVTDSKDLALEGLPAGFVLSPGDYLSFDYGASNASRALHRVSAAATANGSGNVTVEVRPFVRVGWEDGATVALYRASAKMIIVPGTYSEQTEPPNFVTLSFDAIQSL